jgi:HAD superfamily hydrolase (TIGR01549 family)
VVLNMIKAIIFDFDMTLINSLYIGRKSRQMLGEKYGIFMKSITEKQAFGMNHEGFAKVLEKDNPDKLDWQKIDKVNMEYMKTIFDTESLMHMKLLLDLNKSGIRLGIISGNTSQIIIDFLKNKKNKGKVKFDFIFTTDGLNKGKSKSDLIKECLNNWDIKSIECIYVGDHPNDIIAAKEAKVISAAVPSGLHSKEELKSYNPEILIDNLDKLKEFISEIKT